jgi:monooxygenase
MQLNKEQTDNEPILHQRTFAYAANHLKGIDMNDTHVDVIIVGAGLSGIGAGYHVQKNCPDKSYLILEAREQMGGTWDLFKYPGIRSDSDMHTLGYKFKPWRAEKAIAEGPAILEYIKETADENNMGDNIRYRHRMKKASWSNEKSVWTISVEQSDGQEDIHYTCKYLLMCAGYYRYKEGFTPEFPGREQFGGELIHPQLWPENLDYKNKKIVIVGSGATAVTLMPVLAEQAEHVTMLQRSPTYMMSRPFVDHFANFLRKIMPEKWAYAVTRWKNITRGDWFYKRTRTSPDKVKDMIMNALRKELDGDHDIDIEKHFTPSYDPWDQRMCLVPDGDLFVSLNSGKSSIVTDQIETFTPTGIKLQSGKELEADIIISATGLNMVQLGEAEFEVDGKIVDFSKTWTYKGLMYSGVPNLVSTFGYINASWTLGADLTAEYFCRMINYMENDGHNQVTPTLREQDKDMVPRPWIDDFSAGYMQRVMPLLPRQGDKAPWLNTQDYKADKKLRGKAKFDDGALVFKH